MKSILLIAASTLVLSMTLATSAAAADLVPEISGAVMVEADEPLSWYASAKIGVALPGTINLTATSAAFPDLNGEATFDPGLAAAVAIGKHLTPNVRAEVELAVANNAGSTFSGSFAGGGTTSGTLTGSVTTTSLMAMGYYEFTQFGDFVPYLSAGIGGANVSSDLTYNDPLDAGMAGTITGNSLVLAGRIGAGLRFEASDSVDITLDYSALIGSRASLTYTGTGGAGERDVSADVMGHVLAIGVKAEF